jgi:hypothetical protein
MITVGRLAPKDQWDQNILDRLFDNTLYPTGLEFKRHEGYPTTSGCVLIIPGRYWWEKTNQISESISRYDWVLGIRTGDEENLFDPDRVFHRNIKWWIQTPHLGFDYPEGSRFLGVGFPPHFNNLKQQPRDTDVFLAAQNTHQRRRECFTALATVERINAVVQPTDGFTHGMACEEYATWMCSAKVAPAPSGPASPDSFRLFEALEAHTVPIADDLAPGQSEEGFWRMVFPDAPFPILNSFVQLPGYVRDQLCAWPNNSNEITAWWIRQKRDMSRWIREDLTELGAL